MARRTIKELTLENQALRAELSALKVTTAALRAQGDDLRRIVSGTTKATVVYEWEEKSDAYKHREAATLRARAEGKPWNYGVSHRNGKHQVVRYEKAAH